MNLTTKHYILLLSFVSIAFLSFSQSQTSIWKGQIAFGANFPSSNGFVENFEANSFNFPTINLGIQNMFSNQLGAKLDYGYNRIKSADNSPEFKLNYSRINAQLVYDANRALTFTPNRIGIIAHAGPGMSFVKPLSSYSDNKLSFFNVMAGVEFHYGISETFSVYLDTSYILGFSKDFDPVTDGYGSFNGDLLTVTLGVSFSLSGCQYCD
ncbi:MAG: cell envelope biogenesis protein OmpA [Flavobacteriaceae bacterium]